MEDCLRFRQTSVDIATSYMWQHRTTDPRRIIPRAGENGNVRRATCIERRFKNMPGLHRFFLRKIRRCHICKCEDSYASHFVPAYHNLLHLRLDFADAEPTRQCNSVREGRTPPGN